jgi:hypothetical protein
MVMNTSVKKKVLLCHLHGHRMQMARCVTSPLKMVTEQLGMLNWCAIPMHQQLLELMGSEEQCLSFFTW